MIRKYLKDENGLTLVELLAVVVILGIISSIAVPSIGGLIDNSRKDAHVANAQQMINATKIAVAGNPDLIPADGSTETITLEALENGGYIETLKDPDNGSYDRDDSMVVIENDDNKLSYSVKLINGSRGVQDASDDPVPQGQLGRDQVRNN